MPDHFTPESCGTCPSCDKPLALCAWCGDYWDLHSEPAKAACVAKLDGDMEWYADELTAIRVHKSRSWYDEDEYEEGCRRCTPAEARGR